MKKPLLLISICCAVGLSQLHAATITTFAGLGTADRTEDPGTTFSSPSGGVDQADFTFQFTFTTPTALTGKFALVDFGGANGTSVVLEDDNLVFRSGLNNGDIMYLSSPDLSASTQYEVTGSIFMDTIGTSDQLRLYLNGADGVDPSQPFHNPSANIGDWAGGNSGGYGIGGGDIQSGTTQGDGTATFASFTDTDGTLDSSLAMYEGKFLDVVPEPSTFAMFASMLFGWVMVRRRS